MQTRIPLFALVVLAALARVAAADGKAAFELTLGERPDDTDELLAPIFEELAGHGFHTRGTLVADIERVMSRGTIELTASDTLTAQGHVDRGYDAFIEGEYGKAAVAMESALAIYERAPAQLAREAPLRDRQFQALVVLARSYDVLGFHEDAFKMVAQLIRFFPDRSPTTLEYDPRVIALYRKSRSALEKQGTGSLEIKVDDPTSLVLVDHRIVGTGSVRVDGLIPGTHSVYVAPKGERLGRSHNVEVNPRSVATLAVSWQLDGALTTGRQFASLSLPAGATPREEIVAATTLGRALSLERVVVLSVRDLDDRRSIVGWSISINSQTRVFAAVQIEPIMPPTAVLTQLGALLAGARGVNKRGIITREIPLDADLSGNAHSPWYADPWGWGLTGTGAIATGVAAGFAVGARGLRDEADHESNEERRHDLRDRADRKIVVASAVGAVGAALLVSGVIKLIRHDGDEHPERHARARVVFGGNWVALQGRF